MRKEGDGLFFEEYQYQDLCDEGKYVKTFQLKDFNLDSKVYGIFRSPKERDIDDPSLRYLLSGALLYAHDFSTNVMSKVMEFDHLRTEPYIVFVLKNNIYVWSINSSVIFCQFFFLV